MGDKLRNVLIRTLSGAVLLAVVLAAAYISHLTYAALLFVIATVGMWEFYKLASATGAKPQRCVGLMAGVALLYQSFVLFDSFVGGEGLFALEGVDFVGILAFVLLVAASFVVELFRNIKSPTRNIATTLMATFYVALPMSLMLFIPLMLAGGQWRAEAFLFYLFIVWANDVFAFLVGITCGRHRLCERISPKKSWEGFFGGVAGAMAMGAVGAAVVGGGYALWLGLAAVVAITSVLGDLVESMFKREAEVKDSGNILPGHGGMLDRFDALLLSSPAAFVYLIIMIL